MTKTSCEVLITLMDAEALRRTLNQHSQTQEVQTNPQLIYEWSAPLRAYKKQSKGVLRFYVALACMLSFIAYFFGEIILILPIWAVLFLVYALTITPAPTVVNKITKFGIETAGRAYRWEKLSHFYFLRKFDFYQLVVVSAPPRYIEIILVVTDEKTKQEVLKHLAEHLIYQEEPHKNFTDHLADLLMSLLPNFEDEKIAPSESAEAPLSPQTASPSV